MRQAALANLAFVSLALANPVVALTSAQELLSLPTHTEVYKYPFVSYLCIFVIILLVFENHEISCARVRSRVSMHAGTCHGSHRPPLSLHHRRPHPSKQPSFSPARHPFLSVSSPRSSLLSTLPTLPTLSFPSFLPLSFPPSDCADTPP